ncbi:uncharacterized protein AMSG_09935 [Thecamonas trahens ATCC 50062]|uniref:FAD-binding FR-type domain-containing protein n=1 Tax=Thecamonas trahens ATCC 50062 TaxID=461836 RepID=A0A0L0DPG9_THETB|nr:hypothetical protein AMSG_09935 [Thecamonas trahens ATCC 50062]KNC54155.1 hypothetical protein AMSG_09935 [Thecamonas trahens ATCC 50062]|eukprot:XP_013753976.1 hypothetical protein AMSG_09935 [Thecamonas trahens ATCC 50062]
MGELSLVQIALIVAHFIAIGLGYALLMAGAQSGGPSAAEAEAVNRHSEIKPSVGQLQWRVVLGMGPFAAGSISILFLPILRSRWYTILTGIPFERRIVIHRIFARLFVGLMLVHGVGVLVLSEFEGLAFPSHNSAGLIAMLLFLFVAATAIEPIRRAHFDFFFRSHYVFIAALVATFFHAPLITILACAPVFVWGCVALLRVALVLRNRTTLVSCRTLPGDVTELVLARDGFHAEPGQYVFIGDPLLGWELHPFTVSNYAPRGGTDLRPAGTMRFLIKAAALGPKPREWTSQLYNAVAAWEATGAASDSSSESSFNSQAAHLSGSQRRTLAARGDAPLHMRFEVLVSGGIGVTPNAALLEALLAPDGPYGRPDKIVFVWSSRGADPFATWFPHLLAAAADDDSVELELYDTSVHTKSDDSPSRLRSRRIHPDSSSSAGSSPSSSASEEQEARRRATSSSSSSSEDGYSSAVSVSTSLCDSLDVRGGRPDIGSLLAELPERAGVFVCGPMALVDATVAACSEFGHHVHTESFLF